MSKKKNKSAVISDARWKLWEHPLFSSLDGLMSVVESKELPSHCWAQFRKGYGYGPTLNVNSNKNLSEDEWVYILALGYLHVGLNHITECKTAKDLAAKQHSYISQAHSFASQMGVGKRPEAMQGNTGISGEKMPIFHENSYTWGYSIESFEAREEAFNRGLQLSAQAAIAEVSYLSQNRTRVSKNLREANIWVINSFPLLSSLASSFKLVEDEEICKRMHIDIAAIHPVLQEVYIHPRWRFTRQEMIFILLHEYLHIGLRHDLREQGRDPFYWNVACDYVINGWLMEMDVGQMPTMGLLYDPQLAGRGAEDIYDDIMQNIHWQRRIKRQKTPRGGQKPDVITDKPPSWWISGDGVSLDEFYRYSVYEGLDYAEKRGQGYIPAGLIEEIRAISQPPIPWDVQLTEWFDQFFPPLEKRRSYARLSRRQSSSPDIPRPASIHSTEDARDRTFGVLLDTSGSMSRTELAKALGAISAYALSREVRFIRLVFCDAMPYDAGYVDVDQLLQTVEIKGRGGTTLQPAVNLLRDSVDFPDKGPLLIITDGYIDVLRIPMQHAYLMPQGCRLDYKTTAPVFYFD